MDCTSLTDLQGTYCSVQQSTSSPVCAAEATANWHQIALPGSQQSWLFKANTLCCRKAAAFAGSFACCVLKTRSCVCSLLHFTLAATGAHSGKTNTGKAAANGSTHPDMGTLPSQLPGQPGPKKTQEEIVCPRDKRAWDRPQPAGTPGRLLCKGLWHLLEQSATRDEASAQDGMWAPTGEHKVTRSWGGGHGGERGIPAGWFLKTFN